MKSIGKRLSILLPLIILGCIVSAQTSFPVRISSNKRYLVDQDNKPFPVLGRTAWMIISQPESGYKKFIQHTVAHGYNAIEMAGIYHWPNGKKAPYNGRKDLPFLKRLDGTAWTGSLIYTNKSNEAPDFTTPNEQYWLYLDSFLSYCESNGILVFFFPGYVGYVGAEQGWMQELLANGPQKVQAYGSWIANRYKNRKNLVWMLLGDMGIFTPEQKIAESALITGLKSVPNQQSIYYSAEANSGQNSADQIDFGDQMTLNGVYTWGQVALPRLARSGYAHQPVMPSYLLEEPYDEEGPDGNSYNPHSIQPVRRFQWWGWLITTSGYISGNGYIWPFIDPVWEQHLDTKNTREMSILNGFVRSIRWWELVPSGLSGMKHLITVGAGNDTSANYVAASATQDGKMLIAYIPPAHAGTISVDMTAMSGNASASWFDPTNGTYTKIPGKSIANKGEHQFVTPGKNSRGEMDWVLVLKKD